MHAGCEVLMEADDNSALIVGDDPQGILGQEFTPCPIHLLTIIFIIILLIILILLLNFQLSCTKAETSTPLCLGSLGSATHREHSIHNIEIA